MAPTARDFVGKHLGPESGRELRVTSGEAARFWCHVKKSEGSGCWIWTGHRSNGYGSMTLTRHGAHSPYGAHRIAYAIENGVTPAGLVVMHECDNKPCVRVSHLRIGTQKQNARDAWARGLCGPIATTCTVCGGARDKTITSALCRPCYTRRNNASAQVLNDTARLLSWQDAWWNLICTIPFVPPSSLAELTAVVGVRRATMFARYYGLYDFDGETLQSIADTEGCSRERVRQHVQRVADLHVGITIKQRKAA
jgi:HNH endonuclease